MSLARPLRLERFEDWPVRLNAAVDAARAKPFDLLTHNCATFAADCVEAMTGVSLHGEFAFLHEDERTALRMSAVLEGEVALVLSDLPQVLPAFAQRGDLVIFANEGRDVLGVCVGTDIAAVGAFGLQFVPKRGVKCAWRV